MRQFTTIKGAFSESRELPRIGKIRLGLKVQGKNGSHPTETDYFVCPPEVQAAYTETPTELDVLLPSNKREDIFRSKYALYGAGAGLKCHGNGEEAERFNEQTKAWEKRTCVCELLKTDENPKGTCTAKSDLMVMLPLVSMGGCYQIKTGSAAATRNINSSLDLIQFLTGGRIAFLPMKLRRVPIDMTHQGHKRTHYIMTLTLNATWQQALQLRQNPDSMVIPAEYQIAAPLDENPELDPDDVVVDAETLADASDAELAEVQKKLQAQQAKKTVQGDGLDKTASGTPKADNGAFQQVQDAPAPKPSPQQTPGPSASTRPDQAIAGGTTVKSEAPTNGNLVLIPKEEWDSLVFEIDNQPELNEIKKRWKTANNVSNITHLKAGGQHLLLKFVRDEAAKMGVTVNF